MKWFLAIYLSTQSKNDIAALDGAPAGRQMGYGLADQGKLDETMRFVIETISSRAMCNSMTPIWAAKSRASAGAERRKRSLSSSPCRRVRISRSVRSRGASEVHEQRNQSLRCGEYRGRLARRHRRSRLLCGADQRRHDAPANRYGRQPARRTRIQMGHTGLGNIKSAITETCRAVRLRDAARYLAAFEYRFNRRFELDKMVERLATVAAKTTPKPRYVISPEVMLGNQVPE